MNWENPAAFFAMGGYGLYVWGSYAMVALWMLYEPFAVSRRHQAALRHAAANLAPKDPL